MADDVIICWNCRARVDGDRCPVCKAGIASLGGGEADERWRQEQQDLKRQLGVSASDQPAVRLDDQPAMNTGRKAVAGVAGLVVVVVVTFAWFVALVAIALLASVSQSAGSGNDSAGAALAIGIATISILGIAIIYFSIRGLGRWAKNG